MPHHILDKGFRPLPITQDHYKLGGGVIPWSIINLGGHWKPYTVLPECQSTNTFETYGCTTFATLNALEILKKKITGVETDYSDRFTYISSDTVPPGNDPHIVAESIRKGGVLNDEDLPFSPDIDSLAKFDDMGPHGGDLILKATTWLKEFNFGHEWVFEPGDSVSITEKQNRLKDALQYSPIGISVRAWMQRDNGMYFKNHGDYDNHWVCLIDFEEGVSWTVFDTYPDSTGTFLKTLEWDFDFGYAKKYYLSPRSSESPSTFSLVSTKWLWTTIKKILAILHL